MIRGVHYKNEHRVRDMHRTVASSVVVVVDGDVVVVGGGDVWVQDMFYGQFDSPHPPVKRTRSRKKKSVLSVVFVG